MPTLCVVEDDENLREVLADNLEDEGYTVRRCADLAAAEQVLASAVDLWILDVMLPDGDGYSLCRRVRAQDPRVPIIMLTARTLEQDVVAGFAEGADDYVAKPYRLAELLARIQARLRSASPSRYQLGAYVLDVKANTLQGPGAELIELTKTEFALLRHFVAHPGESCSRERLLAAIWGEATHVDPRTIDNFVLSLRRKLRCDDHTDFAIATVRGVGYRFDLGVA